MLGRLCDQVWYDYDNNGIHTRVVVENGVVDEQWNTNKRYQYVKHKIVTFDSRSGGRIGLGVERKKTFHSGGLIFPAFEQAPGWHEANMTISRPGRFF